MSLGLIVLTMLTAAVTTVLTEKGGRKGGVVTVEDRTAVLLLMLRRGGTSWLEPSPRASKWRMPTSVHRHHHRCSERHASALA
jgi:hypothetical protein